MNFGGNLLFENNFIVGNMFNLDTITSSNDIYSQTETVGIIFQGNITFKKNHVIQGNDN